MNQKNYIQVGVTALRKQTGEYLEFYPLYIETENLSASGLTPQHENSLHDFAGFFIKKHNELQAQNKERNWPTNLSLLSAN